MDQLIKPQNLTLSSEQFSMLLPYLIVSLGAMVSLLIGVIQTPKKNLAALSTCLVTIGLALYATVQVWGEPTMPLFNNMMLADYFAGLFNVIFLVATALVILTSYSYLDREQIHYPEYYSLLLFACLGMMLLVSATDLVVLFVALEIMSIAVYVLVGFRRSDTKSNEAALKYFILGSAASAVLLFGSALLYGATGSMNIAQIGAAARALTSANPLFSLGAVMVVVGFLFKVATVPFHMWMPDVYEGAPTTVTNFMTTGLKAAAFGAFMRVFIAAGLGGDAAGITSGIAGAMHNILWVVAVLTMAIGNVIALTQRNIKRMLAYSSIAHSGYILVGLLVGGRSEYGYASVVLYLIGYVIMNLGAFAVISMLGERGDKNTDIQDFAGIGFKHPYLGFAMAVFMFSMAGVPPTVGFAGKFLIFSSAVAAGETTLAVLAVLCSAISAYYYLRVIVYMYMRDPATKVIPRFAFASVMVVAATTFATLQFGLFPSVLIHAAKKAAGI